jgi:uncharacterized protein (TIGR00369 family)
MTDSDFARDEHCFVCGRRNDGGLRLDPSSHDGRALLEWTPDPRFQGYAGVLHGGLISTLLDEAMAHAVVSRVGFSPTVEIAVQFLKPVRTGTPLRVTAEILEERRRVVVAEAELVQEGEVRARARAKFLAPRRPTTQG